MDNIKVSLIIPTYNKASRLKIVLESLKRLKCEQNFEVIIVNDGSDDNTEVLLNQYETQLENLELRIITIKNSGRSFARNIGIKASRGNLLIFSDDDLILSSDFITSHMRMHKDARNLVVHGQILSLPHLKFFKNPSTGELYNGEIAKEQLRSKIITTEMFVNNEIESYLSDNQKISKFENDIINLYERTTINDSYVRWIGFTGGNISVLKNNLETAGFFDSNMGIEWGCEDLELGFRLYKNGLQFMYSCDAKNYHLNHYRKEFLEEHDKPLQYFIQKHNEYSIKLLKKYFHGEYRSLNDWKEEIAVSINNEWINSI